MDLIHIFTYKIIVFYIIINLCFPKGHLYNFTSWMWRHRSFSLPQHSLQPVMWRPAASDALVLLLCEDIFGLKAPKSLISGDRDGQNTRRLAVSLAQTDLPGRCWLLRWVSFMPRQHPSFTQSLLSQCVIFLIGPTGGTRPETRRCRLRLTAGGRNWADVSLKVGQCRKMLSPSATELQCVCVREWEREWDLQALSNWHISAGACHLDFRERSIFSTLQLEVGLTLLRRVFFSAEKLPPTPAHSLKKMCHLSLWECAKRALGGRRCCVKFGLWSLRTPGGILPGGGESRSQ